MQNVRPGDIGMTGDRLMPIIRRVPIAFNNPTINAGTGGAITALDPGIVRSGTPVPGSKPVGGGSTTQPVAHKPPNDTPNPVQNGTPQTENPPKDYGMPWGAGLNPPSWWTNGLVGGWINPNGAPPPSAASNPPTNPPVTPGPTDNGNSSDPVLQGILSALNGSGGGGGATMPAGQGLTPSGLIGSAQPASGGSSAAVVIVLVIVAVLGYFLWERYKGKLKKHEEA